VRGVRVYVVLFNRPDESVVRAVCTTLDRVTEMRAAVLKEEFEVFREEQTQLAADIGMDVDDWDWSERFNSVRSVSIEEFETDVLMGGAA